MFSFLDLKWWSLKIDIKGCHIMIHINSIKGVKKNKYTLVSLDRQLAARIVENKNTLVSLDRQLEARIVENKNTLVSLDI
jgi:hypothetical protein